ncbi:MAG: NAD(P)-binding protein [Phycisphaeraceae bacterium]
MADAQNDNGRNGERRAIVAGFGPVGRAVVNGLDNAGFDVTIIELNGLTVDRQTEMGRAVVLGDVSETETLRRAGIEGAQAFILTIPNEDKVVEACRLARQLSSNVFISARTNHLSKGMQATQAGADHVTVEEVVTANAMQHAVLEGLGAEAPAEDAADW